MKHEKEFRGFDKSDNSGMYQCIGLEEMIEAGMVVMQYTGLKDKNGDKIFEGDIIEIITGYKYEVGMEKYSMGEYKSGVYGYRVDVDGVVIGNIHQNPELLEVKS
jgi:uncharacterized phage protein (TIGR01671 family)